MKISFPMDIETLQGHEWLVICHIRASDLASAPRSTVLFDSLFSTVAFYIISHPPTRYYFCGVHDWTWSFDVFKASWCDGVLRGVWCRRFSCYVCILLKA